uniref:Macro domain-containing protein n=1 Tax=Ditylenchus dipsaci TaxID=166011 RepID=A0A915ESU6_9BILA
MIEVADKLSARFQDCLDYWILEEGIGDHKIQFMGATIRMLISEFFESLNKKKSFQERERKYGEYLENDGHKKQICDDSIQSQFLNIFSSFCRFQPFFASITTRTLFMAHIGSKISVVRGDITKLAVDAIVNAANKSCLAEEAWMVQSMVVYAAGPSLYNECYDLDGCDVGDAKVTGAHEIKQAKAIIHTVGPRIFKGVRDEDRRLLASCYKKSFDLAKEHGLRSISFPCISTGIYSFPNKAAARIVFDTTKKWFDNKENFDAIDKVIFCVFLKKDEDIYNEMLCRLKDDYQDGSGSETSEFSESGASGSSDPEASKSSEHDFEEHKLPEPDPAEINDHCEKEDSGLSDLIQPREDKSPEHENSESPKKTT